MRNFIEWFCAGFVIIIFLACIWGYIYGMYYLITNEYYWRVVIVACLTFCIWCGISSMDWPFDDLL